MKRAYDEENKVFRGEKDTIRGTFEATDNKEAHKKFDEVISKDVSENPDTVVDISSKRLYFEDGKYVYQYTRELKEVEEDYVPTKSAVDTDPTH